MEIYCAGECQICDGSCDLYYKTKEVKTMITVMEAPKSQICAILDRLIFTSGLSERQLPFNGFRTRLSELRLKYGLNVQVRIVEFTNQFNRDSHYNFHYLLEEDKPAAIELYNKLNK